MSDPHPETLIEAYLAGELNASDAERVRAFVEATPSRRGFVAGVRAAVRGEDIAVSPHDIEAAVRALIGRIRGERFGELRREAGRIGGGVATGEQAARPALRGIWGLGTQPLRRGQWYTLAGAMLGVLTLIAGWHSRASYSSGRRPVAMALYETEKGQRANITLTDGTRVVLDVASRLEVPADYPGGDHTVRLTGEAMFTVAHHTERPFTVIAGPATARVLGTSFLVRHYAADTLTTVAVRDGRVAVNATLTPSVVLTTARQLTIGPQGSAGAQPADPEQFSFVTGILTLDNVPLSDAIIRLDRWCDVDIRLGDPVLTRRHITGEYGTCTTAEMKNILEMTFDVRVVRHGQVLTLFPR